MDYKKELEFAKSMAADAGKVMKKYYRIDQGVEIKSNATPLTLADTEVNDTLIERVKNEFPEYGVLGEEASWNETREKLWVCDPIDGTVGYILHIPTSAFSLALVIEGVVKVSVIYNPWVDELYHSVIGGGAFLNNKSIKVSDKKWGEYAHIANSSGGHDIFRDEELVKKLAAEKVFINSSPGIVYHGCLIAAGYIEGRTFTYHTAHDIAAVKLLIEEAGGKVTDIEGNEQRYDQKINGAIMSNGLIHDELVKIVAEAMK